MPYTRAGIVIATMVLILAWHPAQAAKFREIVAFGESTSDTGNVDFAQCPPPAGWPWGPWAPCTTAYYDGNLSNGPVWLEFLADWLRVARPEPSALGGSNYAHAGAKTGDMDNLRVSLLGIGPVSGIPGTEVPGVLKQIGLYLQQRGQFNKRQLVTIWGGTNDVRDLIDPQVDLPVIVGNLAAAVAVSACHGAHHIVVLNQLDASIAPAVRSAGPEAVAATARAVRAFNAALHMAISELQSDAAKTCGNTPNIRLVDVYRLGRIVVELSNRFGFPYSNTQDPAVDLMTFEVRDDVERVNDHLFLDTVHPTTPAHRAIAARVFAALLR